MNEKLRVLDLFSGIGGFSLGLERTGGFETVAFCEIDPYCRAVLRKHWPSVPCYTDVRELGCEQLETDGLGRIDCVVGGYPCQPFSFAGQRRGQEDDRHLWPEVHRLLASIRPTWGLFENVAGHINMGLDQVLSDLEGEGYTAWPLVIPACALDAPHRRDRVWIVAHSNMQRKCGGRGKVQSSHGKIQERHYDAKFSDAGEHGGADVADASSPRLSDNRGSEASTWRERLRTAGYAGCGRRGGEGWSPEPNVGRVAHGVPSRVDRLKALGNAVVPQIPEIIGRAILAAEGKIDMSD
jgi:DNA (cytosine-5)-methyltransferase 1